MSCMLSLCACMDRLIKLRWTGLIKWVWVWLGMGKELEVSHPRLPTQHDLEEITPWSLRWFEEILISFTLISLTLISLTLISLTLISLTLILLTLIFLTLISLTLILVIFCQKFLLFSLNIHKLRTHLVHMEMEQIQPNGTFTHCFTTISIQQQNNCQISIFRFFIKKWLFNPNFRPT